MSKTDKTRPWRIKVKEADSADPYGARQGGYPHTPGIWGCPSSCWQCRGYMKYQTRQHRRQGKAKTRDWRKEYE